MKYKAKLIISHYAGGATHGYFQTVEAGKAVLDDFAKGLAKIKEYSNRDEESVFSFAASGAFYAVDLRKVTGAALEVCEEWVDVVKERHMEFLTEQRDTKKLSEDRGLTAEFEAYTETKVAPFRQQ